MKCKTHTPPLVVALVGGESSGKSTLAATLATYFNTVWSPEFLRSYLDNKTAKGVTQPDNLVSRKDIKPIAEGQFVWESALRQEKKQVVFMDTCLLMTDLYTTHYFGSSPLYLKRYLRQSQYDYFLLLESDLEWVADFQRESAEVSQYFFKQIKTRLEEENQPHAFVKGQGSERLESALNALRLRFPHIFQE